jgi:carboxypeptidase family protein/TonB-dependent receptor-like protein
VNALAEASFLMDDIQCLEWRSSRRYMKETILHLSFSAIVIGVLIASSMPSTFAQSQALNGQIEGTVLDQNNAAVPNSVITVTNIETGATRNVTTDNSGVYRFPLLPLGLYRIIAEAASFKKSIREGIILTTGQTATIDIQLQAGDIKEVVTVSSDASVADAGKTDVGRVMNTREVQNLPLINRNPLNFALLQANVNGRVRGGFVPPNINANGYLRRVSFLLDGNTNNQGDRGSQRFMFMSDTYVSEIQLVTNGFAAEFGNTPGLIMNIVTPSGTNALHGAVSYRLRRPPFYSRPFFFPAADLPDNKADIFTAAIGGAIIKDRWHFYFGYENGTRDDKAVAVRLLTITPANRAQLIAGGLPASIFPAAIPFLETGPFYIFRSDTQLNEKHRLSVRVNHSNLESRNFAQGGLNTLERSADAISKDYGLAVQLASFTPQFLNEFRFQYARRTALVRRNEFSGSGPSIVITGVANFGSPEGLDTIFPTWTITQVQDNLTRTTGTHVVKFGGGFSLYNQAERAAVFSRYTFSSIANYIAARNGTNPRSYTNYAETFGDPEVSYEATFWSLFAQDDWKLTRRLKINYGLRYDVYGIPEADATSPFSASQKFNVDKNNFAPRLGVVYALREGKRPSIIRAGAGIYFDQPVLATYRRALQNNGKARFVNFSFAPTSANAPAFPKTFSGSLPAGSTLPPQDIETVAPDFKTMYAIHSNIQIEQAIAENTSIAVGFIHSDGRHIPIYRNINCLPTGGTLADGRPFFGTRTINPTTGAVTILPCTNRISPQFQNILMVESAGVSQYNALTLQLTKRFSRGLQFSANYTLSKATDDAPEQNLTTGNIQNLVLSDPSNRSVDNGHSFADQRHTFVMSLVARSTLSFQNTALRYLFNDNQVGIIATANSGERFNIISGVDLNRDGVLTSDRPAGIKRNSGTTPPQYNVDLRYSRFFNLTERFKLEVFAEFQNLYNINSIVQFTNVTVTTSASGELIGGLPDFRARNQSLSQDSRQFQLGFKFIF